VVSLGVGLAAGSTGEQQTSIFLCLGLAQLWLALALRAPRTDATWRDRGLEAAVLGAAALLLAAVGWGPLRELLDTASVTLSQAAVVSLVAVVPAVVVGVWSRVAAGVTSRG
jgi:Ca2+-transporting ATPase